MTTIRPLRTAFATALFLAGLNAMLPLNAAPTYSSDFNPEGVTTDIFDIAQGAGAVRSASRRPVFWIAWLSTPGATR